MMTKVLLIAFATFLLASVVTFVVFAGTMMGSMMGSGHMAMMGGAGSNPDQETAVAGFNQVRLENFAFAPANIVIDAGATVTWTNYDSVDHTVTSDDGDALDSPLFGKNETFSHNFDKPGEYRYHCTPHPNMQGLVTVRPAVTG
jgi:plastocyanin